MKKRSRLGRRLGIQIGFFVIQPLESRPEISYLAYRRVQPTPCAFGHPEIPSYTGEHKQIVDIKSGSLFPFPFLVLGALVFLAAMLVFVSSPILSVFLFVTAAFILTAHEGTEIDPSSKTYREYQSFLFVKKGSMKSYDSIEKIFVNSGKSVQRVYTAHTSQSSTFSSVEYNAYLKFSDGVKVFLLSKRNKPKLLDKLRDAARILNVALVDNTKTH